VFQLFKLQGSKILIVDDVKMNIDILKNALEDKYNISFALNGESTFETIRKEIPDLILLDINMPEMDGYEVCQHLKEREDTKNIPVIFLTAMTDIEDKARGFNLGAVDYIIKPFEIVEVEARVKTHLELKFAKEALMMQNELLEELVKDRTKELENVKDATIFSLAAVAETRDPETGSHIMRTQNYVKILAEELSKNAKFKEVLTKEFIELLYKSAPLHDIGKVGVSDIILLKPSRLESAEFDEIKKHPHYAKRALRVAQERLGENSFLKIAQEIAWTHHEKWDGSGYPEGLKGEDIPLSGRLMALVDVYDALISKRVYKEAYSHDEARAIIVEGKAIHFDPYVVEAFLEIEEEFIAIAKQYKDKSES